MKRRWVITFEQGRDSGTLEIGDRFRWLWGAKFYAWCILKVHPLWGATIKSVPYQKRNIRVEL